MARSILAAVLLTAACGKVAGDEAGASPPRLPEGDATTGAVPSLDASAGEEAIQRIDVIDAPALPGGCFAPPDGWIETKLTAEQPSLGLRHPRISGDRLFAIGPDPGGTEEHAVWIYSRQGDRWLRESTNRLSGFSPLEDIGALSVDGRTIAVQQRSTLAVFFYDGNLEERWRLTLGDADDFFPGSVFVRGDTLVTSSGEGVLGIDTYRRSDGLWSAFGRLQPEDQETQSFLPVAFDGSRLLVFRSTEGAGSEELTDVFFRTPTGWQREVAISNEEAIRGAELSGAGIDGDTLALRSRLGHLAIYERLEGRWRMTARAGSSSFGSGTALYGDSLLIGPDLFERADGFWRHALRFRPGDESGGGFGSDIALGEGHLAIGALLDRSWGGTSPVIYAYARSPGVHVEPTCIVEETEEGPGTACRRSGTEPALCALLPSGPAELRGTTPYGDLDLSYGWLDTENGFGRAHILILGDSSPRRLDARPQLSVSIHASAGPEGETTAAATLSLCEAEVTVDANVTLTELGGDGSYAEAPATGTLTIDAPGWNVSGRFDLTAVCRELISR